MEDIFFVEAVSQEENVANLRVLSCEVLISAVRIDANVKGTGIQGNIPEGGKSVGLSALKGVGSQ